MVKDWFERSNLRAITYNHHCKEPTNAFTTTQLDDSDDDTVATVPTTDSESDSDYSSDEETIVTSNCSSKSSATEGAREGVLKSQSRVTHNPGLSQLVSFATLSGHNIS